MPTDRPRVSMAIPEEQYDRIREYWYNTKQKNQTQAILSLLEIGLSSMETENKTASPWSDEAAKVAKEYDELDKYGKRAVLTTIADHKARMEEERREARSKRLEGNAPDPGAPARVIPLYLSPAAAGFASPAFGDDFDYIEVGGEVPAFADFAVKIDGDSMEPYIMDGATVYVNGDPLANGDIGIFFYDGDTFCKQYYRDRMGNVRLLSLNRDRADADRFIPADSDLRLVCHGRVILPTKPRLAVPEEELK